MPIKRSSGRGERELRVRVKTAKGRRIASTRWLDRQLNDPYVRRAQRDGLRSRAAFKLIEMDDKHQFLKPGKSVIDLGCAPGGWCQVAAHRVNTLGKRHGMPIGRVLGIDLNPIESICGVELHVVDFLQQDANHRLSALLGAKADVILSDMAAPMTGHKKTDHLRTNVLAEAVFAFANDSLSTEGVAVVKVLSGGAHSSLQQSIKQSFRFVHHVKPPASRTGSSERYVVAMGFRA